MGDAGGEFSQRLVRAQASRAGKFAMRQGREGRCDSAPWTCLRCLGVNAASNASNCEMCQASYYYTPEAEADMLSRKRDKEKRRADAIAEVERARRAEQLKARFRAKRMTRVSRETRLLHDETAKKAEAEIAAKLALVAAAEEEVEEEQEEELTGAIVQSVLRFSLPEFFCAEALANFTRMLPRHVRPAPERVLLCVQLRHIGIGDDGAIALAQALVGHPTIERVLLPHNGIGDDGATALATALTVNRVVHTLDLDQNLIGDSGASSLAVAFKGNDCLVEVSVAFNKLTDRGVNSLVSSVMRSSASVSRLSVVGNKHLPRTCERVRERVGQADTTMVVHV